MAFSIQAPEGAALPNVFLHPSHVVSASAKPITGSQLFEELHDLPAALAAAVTSDVPVKVLGIDSNGLLLHASLRVPLFLRTFTYRERRGAGAIVISADARDTWVVSDELNLDQLQYNIPQDFHLTNWWILLFPTTTKVADIACLLSTAGAVGSSTMPSSRGWKQQGVFGKGSFATVYKLRKRGCDFDSPAEFMALKIHAAALEEEQNESKELVHELRMMVQVQGHPNIVALRGVLALQLPKPSITTPSAKVRVLGIALDCCPGSLSEVCRERRFTEQQVRVAFQGLLHGLEHIHRRGVVHRDLKPENIFMTSSELPLIGDFGSACFIADVGSRTQAGEVGYIAPEVLLRQDCDERMDLFSLGSCLFFAVKGRNAFGTSEAESLRQSVLGFEAIATEDLKGTSLGLQDFLKLLLEADARRRPRASVARLHRWVRGLTFGVVNAAQDLPIRPRKSMTFVRAVTEPVDLEDSQRDLPMTPKRGLPFVRMMTMTCPNWDEGEEDVDVVRQKSCKEAAQQLAELCRSAPPDVSRPSDERPKPRSKSKGKRETPDAWLQEKLGPLSPRNRTHQAPTLAFFGQKGPQLRTHDTLPALTPRRPATSGLAARARTFEARSPLGGESQKESNRPPPLKFQEDRPSLNG